MMTARQYVVTTTDPSIATTEIAVKEIGTAGFSTTWLATLEQYTDRNRRTRPLKASLFPGYIFVEFDIGHDDWMRIASCRGVRHILGSTPMRPTALPIGALDILRQQFEAGEFKPRPPADFVVGERLTVVNGPFFGHVGICRMSKGERVDVLLRLFGQERPVPLQRDMLRRAVG